ncbi:MAG: AMP-binding protein, partial [Thermomicrobia bacterium]|nr:AMP-binding protein [Thermomicrobia bacterium]
MDLALYDERLSYVHGASDVPLIGSPIGDLFDRVAAQVPEKEALVSCHQGVRYTYRAFQALCNRFARGLMALGVGKALHAARVPDLRTVIAFGCETPGTYRWDDVLETAETVSPEELARVQSEQQFDDPINIQYTSGTTGFPKGVTLSHHSILNNGFFVGEYMRFSPEDRLCIPVPFYHCFGMVLANLACVTHGATMVIPAPGFDAKSTLAAVERERCTALHGVPTMFIAELAHPEFDSFDLSSLRTGTMAGSPCPVEVMKQVNARMNMTDVTICYGMTETAPVSFQSATDDPLDKRVSTVGRVHPHVECKIIDPATGGVVPRGTTGELLSRGYSVMLGYWN